MTTALFSLILLTAGGDRMAVTDPHGWTLTLISVTCVFTALIILYFIYTFSGNLFSGKYKRQPKARAAKGTVDAEVAAAIAMALEAEAGGARGRDAVLAATASKFRPILMSCAAALFGMLPMALGGGLGSELRQSIGIGSVGGILVSSLVSLYFIPALYAALFARRRSAGSKGPRG